MTSALHISFNDYQCLSLKTRSYTASTITKSSQGYFSLVAQIFQLEQFPVDFCCICEKADFKCLIPCRMLMGFGFLEQEEQQQQLEWQLVARSVPENLKSNGMDEVTM